MEAKHCKIGYEHFIQEVPQADFEKYNLVHSKCYYYLHPSLYNSSIFQIDRHEDIFLEEFAYIFYRLPDEPLLMKRVLQTVNLMLSCTTTSTYNKT